MAATDQHFRKQKVLDIVFGASCALMLITTGWMFWQDYNREFKSVQRTFRDVESGLAERDMVEKLPPAESVKEKRILLRRARLALDKAQDWPIDSEGLRIITKTGDESEQPKKVRVDPAGKEHDLLTDDEKPTGYRIQSLGAWDKELKARHDKADEKYRNIKAEFDSKTSYYNIAVDEAARETPGSSRRKSLDDDIAKRKKELEKIQASLNEAKDQLDAIDTEHRNKVRRWLAGPEKAVADAEADEKKVTDQFDRYAKLAVQKGWGYGDAFRALPILDAFESPTKIKQIWLPDLTIDYSFKDVPRYDRCTSCHLGIDRGTFDKATLAKLSDADENRRLQGKLLDAQEMLEKRVAAGEKLGFDPTDLPGEQRAHPGWIALLLVLSTIVAAGSLGILERSYRLGVRVLTAGLAFTLITTGAIAFWSPRVPGIKTVKLDEGQITQYAAHPRLDLFVDANSPHSMEKFGCTICHAGQGSATEFILASHTPNNMAQEEIWKDRHNWSSIHHWDFPMLTKRFVESSCVKCHHQITDLITKGSKEEAPKLLRGYNLVKENGCFGCHEISGIKGNRAVGPDLRLEATPALDYLSAAEQERAHSDPSNPPGTMRKVGPSLRRIAEKTDEDWVRKWVQNPRGFRPDTKMPHFFGLSTNSEKYLKDNDPDQQTYPATEIHGIAHYLLVESKLNMEGKDAYRESLLNGKENVFELQQTLAKQGLPDKELKELFDVSRRLADVALLSAPMAHKAINDYAHQQRQHQERISELQRRLKEPKDSSPEELARTPADIKEELKELERVTKLLVEAGRPVPISAKVIGENGEEVTVPEKEGNASNGRRLFTEKGCLACHAHEGTTTPQAGIAAVVGEANFAPELSRVAAKLRPAIGKDSARRWLVQWILNPNVHHPRTRMPITHLKVADANDVATWLLSKKVTDWKEGDPAKPTLDSLKRLARVYLGKAPGMTRTDVDRYLPVDKEAPGIPQHRLHSLARDAEEHALVAGKVTPDSLLWYIGKKAIGRQGCYGCHDIPGFETAKPIGVALNDWGKKDPERLAFEDAVTWAKEHFNIVPTRTTRREVEDRIAALKKKEETARSDKEKEALAKERAKLEERFGVQERIYELEKQAETKKGLSSEEQRELEVIAPLKLFEAHDGKQPVEEIFFKALEHPHQSREGFLHQKLIEPRSYDFNRERVWDDRLRMPQFRFARSRQHKGETTEQYHARLEKEEAEAREAVMTFILGLVADPIPLQYLPQPKPERKAEIVGRQVLDKFNCAGCHQVRPGVYEVPLKPEKKGEEVLKLALGAYDTVSAGIKADYRFPNHSAWVGTPPTSDTLTVYGSFDAAKSKEEPVDYINLAEAFRFIPGDKVARDLPADSQALPLPRGQYTASHPFGGTFVELLSPYVKKMYPTLGETPPNAILPPPLTREGERVQPDWLYKFLLNPGPVRPESYMALRMPKFNMSPEEARAIVNYFAAVAKLTNPGAGVTYPYVAMDQRDPEYWKRMSEQYADRVKEWEADTRKQLAADEKALPGLKKAAEEAKKKKAADLADKEKALADTQTRIEVLKQKLDKGSFAGRIKQMTSVWSAKAKKELADAEDALPELKKAVADAKEKKAPTLAEKEKQLAEVRGRIEKLTQQVKKAEFPEQQKHWRSAEMYGRDGFTLLTRTVPCMQCHSIGHWKAEAEKAPNLELAAERLRPEWTARWLANPARQFTYPPAMPQNFPAKPDSIKFDYQETFAGKPFDQIKAVRDILMDQARLHDLLATTPHPPPGGGPK